MTNALARCAMIAFVLLPSATVAEPIKLTMAYFSSDREPPYVSVMRPFADAVNKEAKGLVEIVPCSGGSLGRSYPQQAQEVLNGAADMAWVNPSLTPARFPDNDVLGSPGLFRDLREATLVCSRLVAAGALRRVDLSEMAGTSQDKPGHDTLCRVRLGRDRNGCGAGRDQGAGCDAGAGRPVAHSDLGGSRR